MKKLLAVLFLIAALFGIWWFFFREPVVKEEVEQQGTVQEKNPVKFNQKIENVLNFYDGMRAAFVEADTMNAKKSAREFIIRLDSIDLAEIKDTSASAGSAASHVKEMRSNAEAMLAETNITEMRQDFRMISENLYPFLKLTRYNNTKLYWQTCPMAFGDNEASWLSSSSEIMNPYLGKSHPEYKGTMLHCGHITDSIQ